jgi:hypothetical protein
MIDIPADLISYQEHCMTKQTGTREVLTACCGTGWGDAGTDQIRPDQPWESCEPAAQFTQEILPSVFLGVIEPPSPWTRAKRQRFRETRSSPLVCIGMARTGSEKNPRI